MERYSTKQSPYLTLNLSQDEFNSLTPALPMCYNLGIVERMYYTYSDPGYNRGGGYTAWASSTTGRPDIELYPCQHPYALFTNGETVTVVSLKSRTLTHPPADEWEEYYPEELLVTLHCACVLEALRDMWDAGYEWAQLRESGMLGRWRCSTITRGPRADTSLRAVHIPITQPLVYTHRAEYPLISLRHIEEAPRIHHSLGDTLQWEIEHWEHPTTIFTRLLTRVDRAPGTP